MSEWYSIEVFDGASSAGLWAEAHGDPILESALLSGAKDWSWQHHSWGVILEVGTLGGRSPTCRPLLTLCRTRSAA